MNLEFSRFDDNFGHLFGPKTVGQQKPLSILVQSGPENPSVNWVLLYSKTKIVGPYVGGSIIVTLVNTFSIAQICVPFT